MFLYHRRLEDTSQRRWFKTAGKDGAACKESGGKLEAYYFAFDDDDIVIIADLPNNVTGMAASLIGNTGGNIRIKTTVLLTPEEVDEATQKTVDYRPPGQ